MVSSCLVVGFCTHVNLLLERRILQNICACGCLQNNKIWNSVLSVFILILTCVANSDPKTYCASKTKSSKHPLYSKIKLHWTETPDIKYFQRAGNSIMQKFIQNRATGTICIKCADLPRLCVLDKNKLLQLRQVRRASCSWIENVITHKHLAHVQNCVINRDLN